MEELSGKGSRKPSGGVDEREEKVAAEGVVRKKGVQEQGESLGQAMLADR